MKNSLETPLRASGTTSDQENYGSNDQQSAEDEEAKRRKIEEAEQRKRKILAFLCHPIYLMFYGRSYYDLIGSIVSWTIALSLYLLLLPTAANVAIGIGFAVGGYALTCFASWVGMLFGRWRQHCEKLGKSWPNRIAWMLIFCLLHPLGMLYEVVRFRNGKGDKKSLLALIGSFLAVALILSLYFIYLPAPSMLDIVTGYFLILLASATGALISNAFFLDYKLAATFQNWNFTALAKSFSKFLFIIAIPLAIIVSFVIFPATSQAFMRLSIWQEVLIITGITVPLTVFWKYDKGFFMAYLPTMITLAIALFTGFAFFAPMTFSQDIMLTISICSSFLLLFSFSYNHYLVKKSDTQMTKLFTESHRSFDLFHDYEDNPNNSNELSLKATSQIRKAFAGEFVDKVNRYTQKISRNGTKNTITSTGWTPKSTRSSSIDLTNKNEDEDEAILTASAGSSYAEVSRATSEDSLPGGVDTHNLERKQTKTSLEDMADQYRQKAEEQDIEERFLKQLNKRIKKCYIKLPLDQSNESVETIYRTALDYGHYEIITVLLRHIVQNKTSQHATLGNELVIDSDAQDNEITEESDTQGNEIIEESELLILNLTTTAFPHQTFRQFNPEKLNSILEIIDIIPEQITSGSTVSPTP